jgi:hypothetical protein
LNLIVSRWSSSLACGPQSGPNVNHSLTFLFLITFFLFFLCSRPKYFSVLHVFGWDSLKLPPNLKLLLKYQLIVGLVSPYTNSNSRLVESVVLTNILWVSNWIVLINQEKAKKIKTSTEKSYFTWDSHPRPARSVDTLSYKCRFYVDLMYYAIY